jgi:integrase
MNEVEPIRDRKTLKRVERILAKQSSRELLLFVIGTNTGLRVSDILSLNVEDVKNKDFIDIIEKKRANIKNFHSMKKLKLCFKNIH